MAELDTKKQSPVCPQCGNTPTYRSRRNGYLEWFLHFVLFLSPYRCQKCGKRFFRNRFAFRHSKELHHYPI